jgi:hypothetical protein
MFILKKLKGNLYNAKNISKYIKDKIDMTSFYLLKYNSSLQL